MPFNLAKIQKSSRQVKKFLRKHPKQPGVNAIHNLRTATRSLETTFTTLGIAANSKVRRLLRELRNVRKRAGKVRDMDVLTSDVLTLNQEGESNCYLRLVEYLGAARTKYAKKLRLAIVAAGPRVPRNLKRSSKRLKKLLQQPENTRPAISDAVPAAIAKAIQLSSSLTMPTVLNRQTLHPYRLKVKELRNVLQLSEQSGDQEFVDALGAVKDAIGEWHDWETLATIADRVLTHGPSCKLVRQLQVTSDVQYDRALSMTNQFRSKYLKAGKPGSRRMKNAALSAPVLRAMSAIAA
jgi:CHAD domain-containing protein